MQHLRFADAAKTALEMRLLPFGGIFNGRDVTGEYFSAKTNFCLDWYPDRRPLLYHHGLDTDAGVTPVGYISGITIKADGGWAQAQLDKRSAYYDALVGLIEQDALGVSSGAMAHLVRVDQKSGHVLQWPVCEGSLTPTEACPVLATVGFEAAKAHFKAIGIDLPEPPAPPPAATDAGLSYVSVQDAGPTTTTITLTDPPAVKVPATKAMPAPDAEPPDAEGSYEDLLEDLHTLLNPADPWLVERGYTSIISTYPDYLICRRWDDGEQSYWRVAYSRDAAGDPVLGTAVAVEQTYTPVKAAAPLTGPLTVAAGALIQQTRAFQAQAEAVAEARIKAGRTISAANMQAMRAHHATLATAVEKLGAFLDGIEQETQAKAKAAARATPAARAAELELLSLLAFAAAH